MKPHTREMQKIANLNERQKALEALISLRGRFITPLDVMEVYAMDFDEAKAVAASANEILLDVQRQLLSEI